MSVSWRINVVENDKSQKSIITSQTGVAGTVVAAKRSLEKPILFARGETQRILNILGAPNFAEQGLLEAIEYNKSYPLWLVSPAKDFRRDYCILYSDGSIEHNDELMGADFSNGSYTGYANLKLDEITINHVSVQPTKIYVDGVQEPIEIGDDGSFTGEGVVGTSTYDSSTKTFTIEATTLTKNACVEVNKVLEDKTSGASVVKPVAIIATRNVSDNLQISLAIKPLRSVMSGTSISVQSYYVHCDVKGTSYLNKTSVWDSIDFSYNIEDKDNFDNPLNIETAFENCDYIEAFYNDELTDIVNTPATFIEGGETKSSTTVYLDKGKRSERVDGTDIAAGYDFFKKANTYPCDLFFDATGESTAASALAEIRGQSSGTGETLGFQPYARVLLPMNATTKSAAMTEINNFAVSRGISAYCGKFKIRNAYSSAHPVFEAVPMGEVAKRHADSIVLSFGGLATAWIDENGVGGQLTSGRIMGLASNQDEFNETDLRELDEARINPIVYDDTFGPMIVSRRTTYMDYSDYSFNDYSGIMDYCLKNIIKNVLPYQLVKMNDADHRARVRARTMSILDPLTAGPYNVISSYAVKCDSENNNDEVLAREEFILEVAIKVTPKSRTIKLVFTNTPQTSSVEEMFE